MYRDPYDQDELLTVSSFAIPRSSQSLRGVQHQPQFFFMGKRGVKPPKFPRVMDIREFVHWTERLQLMSGDTVLTYAVRYKELIGTSTIHAKTKVDQDRRRPKER